MSSLERSTPVVSQNLASGSDGDPDASSIRVSAVSRSQDYSTKIISKFLQAEEHIEPGVCSFRAPCLFLGQALTDVCILSSRRYYHSRWMGLQES